MPVALILVGLLFVAASLSDSDRPTAEDVGPANVRAVVTDNAEAWAVGQIGTEVTTEIIAVLIAGAEATGSSTYSARAVIVRLDSRVLPASAPDAAPPTLAEADTNTVATCVLWDVDVTAKTVAARAATELRRDIGHHPPTDDDELRERCRGTQFGG